MFKTDIKKIRIINQQKSKINNANSEQQPEMSKSETKKAPKEMKNNKTPENDRIIAEMLKYGEKRSIIHPPYSPKSNIE